MTVTIGGTSQTVGWAQGPFDDIGLFHGNVSFNGNTGPVTIQLSRNGVVLATINGIDITNSCTDNIQNYNAWVGYDKSGASVSATPSLSLDEQVCIAGTGAGNFQGLCEFACHLGMSHYALYHIRSRCWVANLGNI